MASAPRVTVLLPARDAAATLPEALASIAAQRLADYELLVIDDGSADATPELLARSAAADPRLRVVRHDRSAGLVASLNEGLDLARGEYVARMDADDIAAPQRLGRQVAHLDAHPEQGACGAWARRFGDDARPMRFAAAPEEIRAALLFYCPIVHPTAMLRLAAFRRHGLRYEEYSHAEDYALWQRAAELFPLANLPEELLRYRVHPASVTGSAANAAAARKSVRRIDRAALARLGIAATDAELDLHHSLRDAARAPLADVEAWLLRLLAANRRVNYYPQDALARAVAERWHHACHTAPGWGVAKWPAYAASPLVKGHPLPLGRAARFLLRAR